VAKKRGKVAWFVEKNMGSGRTSKNKRKGLRIQFFPIILIALKIIIFLKIKHF